MLRRLDSYQRIKLKDGETPYAASRKGEKLIVAIVNPHRDRYGWAHINSYSALAEEKARLEDESQSCFLMSGSGIAGTGDGASCEISLSPPRVQNHHKVSEMRFQFKALQRVHA